jgi:hypothetical protein
MADIFEVTFQQQIYNHVVKNVIHLQGGTDSFSEEFVANDVIQYFMPQILSQQVVPWKWTVVHVKKISPVAGQPYIKEILYGNAQPNTNMAPPVLCVLMELFTANLSKSGRGKFFVSGIDAGRSQTKGWEASLPYYFYLVFDNLKTNYGVNTASRPLVWGVWSRKNSAFYPITSARILTRYGIQRRRNINLIT